MLEDIGAFKIRVPMDEEERAREAEKIVNRLYSSWKEKLGTLSPAELMGRIAFHIARKFEDLNADLMAMENDIRRGEEELDNILLAMD